jgi:lysine 6-dehydrogenase
MTYLPVRQTKFGFEDGPCMKIGVFGSGLMGSAIARDLVKSKSVDQVAVFDIDRRALDSLARAGPSEKLSVNRHDVTHGSETVRLLRKFDVGVGALPHGLSEYAIQSALQAGVSFVDLIFGWRFGQSRINSAAKKKGITIVPACGLAPGLTNILAMDAVERMDSVDEVHIKVGGIPERPRPPLNYRIVFSFEAVLEEYIRKAKIVKNGKLTEAEALSGLETINFPQPIGKLECFYTDGLSTLTETIRNVKEMDEKTIRWPGHAAQIRTLIECGLLEVHPVHVNGQRIVPREFVSKVVSERIRLEKEKDLTVLRVDVTGKREGRRVRHRYQMVDHYDSELKLTSMARTTAFPCSVAAQMLGEGLIHKRGLVPPELAFDKALRGTFMKQLRGRGIRITSTCNSGRY